MSFPRLLRRAAATALACALPVSAGAATITVYYGDDDGFGVGKFATGEVIDPLTSQADGSDAPLTDTRLIADDCGVIACAAPPFAPTGGFPVFSTEGVVTFARLTMRMGAFDRGPNPFDGPNRLVLDGLAVPDQFFTYFSSLDTNEVRVVNYVLPQEFFPLLADGTVSLAGTHISNDTASGSFQVDMIALTITSEPPPPPADVPPPAPMALMASALGLLGLTALRRPRRARAQVRAQVSAQGAAQGRAQARARRDGGR
ncbi:hypothetical protein ACQ5SO_03040 [Rhodovulum sp. DZ06]|uniref:hypothetical protein n=1 Tax=Rhodovulum sp. DZ06 TaxID=3425126 RepID=UPI003D34C6D4